MQIRIIKQIFFILLLSNLLDINTIYAENLSENCVFCNEKILEYQKFYEDEYVLALYTHKPIFPGHSLIIPKRHRERFEELSDVEFLHISQVVKKVNCAVEKVFNTSAYLILQKNGKEVGQTVPHIHFHYIPRQKGDNSTFKFMMRMYVDFLFSPISAEEMHETVEKMKVAMQNC